MAFCTNCGNENPPSVRFCSKCGKEQGITIASCTKCGKTLEKHEKFCSDCGTPVGKKAAPIPKVITQPEPIPKEEKLTKEGRKLITGGPKPTQNRKTSPPPPPKQKASKKKKRGPVGCFFRTLFILISIVIGAALLIIVVNVFFIEDDGATATSTQKIDSNNDDGISDSNIPGIVDIEPGDVSHLPENRIEDAESNSSKPITEGTDIKKAAKSVEDAFSSGDIALLKEQLTQSAQKQYDEVFEQIQPYMKEYAQAFKNRKLSVSTDVYKEYEFTSDTGDKYSVAFAFQPDGSWKLVRF